MSAFEHGGSRFRASIDTRRQPLRRPWMLAVSLAALTLSCACSNRDASEPGAEELINAVSTTRDESARFLALRKLAEIKDPAHIESLVRALRNPLIEIRIAAITAMGEIKDPKAVEPLCNIFRDEKAGRVEKLAAIRSLTKLRDARAVDSLVGALPYARVEASEGLLSFGDLAIPALISALHDADRRTHAAGVLAAIGATAVDPLIEVLRHDRNKLVRLSAVRALAEIQDPRADAALTEALSSGETELAAAAYRFLIQKGRSETEPLLLRVLIAYGRLQMAEDFAASGNPVLKAAAEEWGRMRRFSVTPSPLVNGTGVRWGRAFAPRTQLALFHFDNSLASTSGAEPVKSDGITFVPGRWGSAVSVAKGGMLSYPLSNNWDFRDGTVEMWISPRYDATHAVYTQYNHALLLYHSVKGDQFLFATTGHGFYAGSVISGQFSGAGGGDVSAWRAGEWHHMAFTYSSRHNRQQLYIDGKLITDHQGAMEAPGTGGNTFTVGSDPYGNWSAFVVDELRISSDEQSVEAIHLSASRNRAFTDHEVFRPLRDPY